MSVTPVTFGAHVANDAELRLCGEVGAKRALELGVSEPSNAVTLAVAGAKSIVVDPSAERIARARAEAERHEVRVECHQADFADLGFLTSASVDLALCLHHLGEIDDLARTLRQVHRVLKPSAPLIVAQTHPVRAMLDGAEVVLRRGYGSEGTRTIGQLFMALSRTDFRVDVLHELDAVDEVSPMVPSVLLLRARKLGV